MQVPCSVAPLISANHPVHAAGAIRLFAAFACMFLIGCSTLWIERNEPAPVTESKPVGTQSNESTPPLSLPLPPAPSKPVAVIVGGKLSTFHGLTDALAARMVQPYEIFAIADGSTQSLLNKIRALDPPNVVAIGLPALELASQLKDTDVIYAQVFNPPAGHRGVEPIPPFDMQLAYWQQISAKMQRIGVLGSTRMRNVIDSLESAAAAKNIKVIRREVSSDKETLQVFRAMVPYIDGFVFLPDESVLSPDVIRRIMVHGSRNNLQILVYSPLMFDLGAYLYISAEQTDVAEQIVALLEDHDTHSRALTTMRVRIQTGTSSNEAG